MNTTLLARIVVMLVAAACIPLAAAQSPSSSAAPAAPPGAPATEPPPAQPTMRDDKETIQASEKWLALLDTGKAGTAWDAASPYLKSIVTRKKWIDGITEMRKPFGKLDSRTAEKFARSHELPGAPEGDYSIVEFVSKFKNGKQAAEQIIWKLGDNEVWSVSGYFIR